MKSAVREHGVPKRSEDGFTLVELMVAIVVMGLLTAVAVPLMVMTLENNREEFVLADLSDASTGVETFFAKNPQAQSIDANQMYRFVDKDDETVLGFAGTPSDYCVISAKGYTTEQAILTRDFRHEADERSPYFVYRSADNTITEMTDISGLSCKTVDIAAWGKQ